MRSLAYPAPGSSVQDTTQVAGTGSASRWVRRLPLAGSEHALLGWCRERRYSSAERIALEATQPTPSLVTARAPLSASKVQTRAPMAIARAAQLCWVKRVVAGFLGFSCRGARIRGAHGQACRGLLDWRPMGGAEWAQRGVLAPLRLAGLQVPRGLCVLFECGPRSFDDVGRVGIVSCSCGCEHVVGVG